MLGLVLFFVVMALYAVLAGAGAALVLLRSRRIQVTYEIGIVVAPELEALVRRLEQSDERARASEVRSVVLQAMQDATERVGSL